METIAIIGALYGDEGKGLASDYFCSKFLEKYKPEEGAVVRFQGGAQAGHTVVTPEGQRHVFSHFGSGSLLGVPTILSENFVCNPTLFIKEFRELNEISKGEDIPSVSVAPDAMITTHYDVILNRELENSRGTKRHGTVGAGFGETIEREEVGHVPLRYRDLRSRWLGRILEEIKRYFLERAERLGLDISTYDLDIIQENLFDAIEVFCDYTSTVSPMLYAEGSFKEPKFLVFEGSQGLGLDMVYGDYPYVTRSRTGLTNVKRFCSIYNLKLDKVVYVTRAYSTRHGAGPLKNQGDQSPYKHISDETNKESCFQGKLRFAPINYDKIMELITYDSWDFDGEIRTMVTCLDQVTEDKDNILKRGMAFDKKEFMKFIEGWADYMSYGPTRNDVKEVK